MLTLADAAFVACFHAIATLIFFDFFFSLSDAAFRRHFDIFRRHAADIVFCRYRRSCHVRHHAAASFDIFADAAMLFVSALAASPVAMPRCFSCLLRRPPHTPLLLRRHAFVHAFLLIYCSLFAFHAFA